MSTSTLPSALVVTGARTHNLRSVDVAIPHGTLTVVCGLSGSGKTSLAFDTIFAEGQRRYVESLSAYARQFLGQMDKPDVDRIDGLSPAIAIDQKASASNPRSTVGTVTEVHDHLRLLYARIGVQHCPDCSVPVGVSSVAELADAATALAQAHDGGQLGVLAPLVSGRKGEHRELLDRLRSGGFTRVRVDGALRRLDELEPLDARRRHHIDLVVDRLTLPLSRSRLVDAIELAVGEAEGRVGFVVTDPAGVRLAELAASTEAACSSCDRGFAPLEPRSFSFNSPYGACVDCAGLGSRLDVDLGRVVPDPARSIVDGAVVPFATGMQARWYTQLLSAAVSRLGGDPAGSFEALPDVAKQAVLYGLDEPVPFVFHGVSGRSRPLRARLEGVAPYLIRQLESASESKRSRLGRFLTQVPCRSCAGTRLNPVSGAVRVSGRTLGEVSALPVADAAAWFAELTLPGERDRAVAAPLLAEIVARLGFLVDVGLGYLTLDRVATSLSGGEAQRIRLATQIGSGLVGVLYVLDEPSIGLHPSDTLRLLATLEGLRDLGNTLLVVEHDRDTIDAADFVVEVGPLAGEHGGRIVYAGLPAGLRDLAGGVSLTADYLTSRRRIEVPVRRRPASGSLQVVGARANNLANLDVEFPLGVLTCVTGVSGSGKSTLVSDILALALRRTIDGASVTPAAHTAITGIDELDKVVLVDQSPIGRTPRSNPATYLGVFDHIRGLFAATELARTRGYTPGRFSFNVAGGRCESCRGDGMLRIEMQFLADVYVACEACGGRRYNEATLEVRYRGRSIADVLELSVDEAAEVFAAVPRISRLLEVLRSVGLGYLRLGQPATTLSGGEAQRLKLASELQRRATGRTVYILDEPTTGLHFDDVRRLLGVLHTLVERGSTVIVIEHDLDVVKTADWVIDLGPGGGPAGGRVVVAGTPEAVAACPESVTGVHLAARLADDGPDDGPVADVTAPAQDVAGGTVARRRSRATPRATP